MLRTHSFFLSPLLLASILFDFYTALNYVYDSFARLVRRTLCSVIAASISFNLTTFLLSSQPSSLKRWNTSHSLIEFLTTTRKNETTCIPNRDLRNASISLLMCSCKMITVESSNLVAIAKCNRFKSYYINNICHLRSFSLHFVNSTNPNWCQWLITLCAFRSVIVYSNAIDRIFLYLRWFSFLFTQRYAVIHSTITVFSVRWNGWDGTVRKHQLNQWKGRKNEELNLNLCHLKLNAGGNQ